MKFIYTFLIVIVVLFLAWHLIPIAFMLMRLLIGLGVLLVFGAGFWLGTKFGSKE